MTPATTTPEREAAPKRWAILGAGGISERFAGCLARVDDAQLLAVGSRRPESVAQFATRVGAIKAYGSYDELVDDDDIDIVYVGNDHVDHVPTALLCVERGRHLLVEKPLGVRRDDAERLFTAARDAGTFVMEAMWTRFLPALQAARRVARSGQLGRLVSAEFSFGAVVDPHKSPRIFDPWRAGGALLDRGIYPISMAHMLLGPATQVVHASSRIRDGIDLETTATVRHGEVLVHYRAACDTSVPNTATLIGERARLTIPAVLIRPERFMIRTSDGTEQTHEHPLDGHGFEHEIRAVHEALDNGWLEHPDWKHADTLDTHAVMDEIRRRTGLRFPFEPNEPRGTEQLRAPE
ncbi:putative dehydrogenase [Ilumatobacter fluminis]|uniref:Putative dehydrogenase n=1 Tax=Ilumatobacter fluminis TaxID=467091 RepID=A0A4V3EIL0_9ACTN|nr:Gfo/Idh/MocA family oxidoreductase [Ilumatobacter fluminis]TDT14908.1 putative dehydrogenase [Ilumatobacter fluminis]